MAQRVRIPSLDPRPFPVRSLLLCLLLALTLCVAQGQSEATRPAHQAKASPQQPAEAPGGDKARQRTQPQPDSRYPAKLEITGEPTEVKIRLPDTDEVELVQLTDGSYRYLLYHGSRTESLTPVEFTQRLATDRGTPLKTLLNITTPMGMAWVSLGLLGQVLFTGRMVVQWFVSEKHKRSVVPVSFWWMSLGGGILLMVYFIWRKDIVGVLGQSTGVLIYARNLWLIFLRSGKKKTLVKGGEGDVNAEPAGRTSDANSDDSPGAAGEAPAMGSISPPAAERGHVG